MGKRKQLKGCDMVGLALHDLRYTCKVWLEREEAGGKETSLKAVAVIQARNGARLNLQAWQWNLKVTHGFNRINSQGP